MTIKLCVIMDPLSSIHYEKDTTVGILLEAQRRKWEIYYSQASDLFLAENNVSVIGTRIDVQANPNQWATIISKPQTISLSKFDVVLMRKDPPFDLAYLYATYLLELAEKTGCLVVNSARSLRDANEKFFITHFPQCCPPTIVTSQPQLLKTFLNEQKKIIVKPLHTMGGQSVFVLTPDFPSLNAMFELLTRNGTFPIMAQRFLPEIAQGDKRILLINGKPYPYGLARIPAPGDIRGNLVAGAQPKGFELTVRDRWICEQLAPTLIAKGLFFVGIDVIGEYLTEINVTSPTCVREIEKIYQVNICADIVDGLVELLKTK